jgi:hypothetical protein
MAAPIPGGLLVQGRFPLDDKYWVASASNLDDGLVYDGLHRWTKDTQQEYVRKFGIWKLVNNEGKSGTVTIGSVTSGSPLSITNSGTEENAVLEFVIPSGGGSSITLKSLAFTVNNNGLNTFTIPETSKIVTVWKDEFIVVLVNVSKYFRTAVISSNYSIDVNNVLTVTTGANLKIGDKIEVVYQVVSIAGSDATSPPNNTGNSTPPTTFNTTITPTFNSTSNNYVGTNSTVRWTTPNSVIPFKLNTPLSTNEAPNPAVMRVYNAANVLLGTASFNGADTGVAYFGIEYPTGSTQITGTMSDESGIRTGRLVFTDGDIHLNV